jgi:uncharacterized membrane protein
MAATTVEKVGKNVTKAAKRGTDNLVEDPKRLAVAGVALAAVPLAAQGLAKLGMPKVSAKVADAGEKAKDKAKSQVKDTVKGSVEEATPSPLKGLFGGNGDSAGSDDDESSNGRAAPGFGSGRRMPIQQAIDVAVPVKTAYEQWTRFEDWPEFMHRIERVEQVDDATVSFDAKIWGVHKRFEADILEQRPDERIEWSVSEGYAHTGLVTFHPLADNLTRIDLTLDVEPSNLIDKASRGMRFVKRAVRGDLHRFKAYVELADEHEDGWRGTIEDGRVKRKTSGGQSKR